MLGSKRRLYAASSNPHIQKSKSLVIKSNFTVHVFCRHVEMNTIGNYKISKHETDKNTHEILMKSTKKMVIEQQQTKSQNRIFI